MQHHGYMYSVCVCLPIMLDLSGKDKFIKVELKIDVVSH